jgi:type IV secretory pathway VirB10-like protein
VSLINEALRKARQAASEHESKQPDGPFRPSRAYPSRRSRHGSGLLAMLVIAVAAGVVGAAAAWWLLSESKPAPAEIPVVEGPSLEVATSPATPEVFPTPVDEPVTAAPPEAPPERESAPAEVEQTATEPEPAASVAEESVTDSDDNRVFVMEAELGYASLSLGYIVARSSNPFAEINGTEVWIDSEIEGFVVEAIEADRVVLRDANGLLVLRVP